MLAALLSTLWLLDPRPPLSDAERLPPLKVIENLLEFNAGCRCWLANRLECDHLNAEAIHHALADLRWRWRAWELAKDARTEHYTPNTRRTALAELREHLGEADYAAGRWPAHVPWWRFRRVGK